MAKRALDQLPLGSFQPTASNWCHSMGELVKVDFEWTIHIYELRGSGLGLRSTRFPAVKTYDESMTWHLILTDQGISLLHSPFPTYDVRVKTALVNARREKVFSNEIVTQNDVIANRISRETILDKSNDLLVNGALTIYCEIETYEIREFLSGQSARNVSQQLNGKEELVKDFEKLFENVELSDVTFNVCSQQFPAHKLILVTRSQVFAAMFQHPSKEKLSGVVDVPDIEPNVFKELLRYMYKGEVPLNRMDEVAIGLLAAADKYLLENLKKICEDHLINQMSPENCIKLLSLNENDPAYYLREKAVEYIYRTGKKQKMENAM